MPPAARPDRRALAPACGSVRRLRSPRPISIRAADRCWSDAARAAAAARSAWTTGGWEQLEPWLTVRVELPVGPLIVIQRQLGHTNLGNRSIYLQGIDNTEFIDTVHARRPPMVPVYSSLAP
jgi:hypothetical protein